MKQPPDASVAQPGEYVETLQAELRELKRALWAVQVLDAWAGQHVGSGGRLPMNWALWPDCGLQAGCCVMWSDETTRSFYGPTPDAARLHAAEAVWPELPADVRALLGECP
jgi:hypothetical protein